MYVNINIQNIFEKFVSEKYQQFNVISCLRGPATRFRMRQSNWGPTDTWGIARLYIGQQCPAMCGGHGECREGICQ